MRPGLGVQPSGGVHDDRARPLVHADPDRLERHAGRVGFFALGPHHLGASPFGPGLELVGGGGAERVGGPEHHRLALADERPGELPGDRGLAGPVDPHDEHDGGPAPV